MVLEVRVGLRAVVVRELKALPVRPALEVRLGLWGARIGDHLALGRGDQEVQGELGIGVVPLLDHLHAEVARVEGDAELGILDPDLQDFARVRTTVCMSEQMARGGWASYRMKRTNAPTTAFSFDVGARRRYGCDWEAMQLRFPRFPQDSTRRGSRSWHTMVWFRVKW